MDPAQAPEAPPARTGRYALGVLALAAAAAILWLAIPVGIGLLLGMLTAFVLQPYYGRLRARTRRPELSALLCVAAAAVVLLAGLGGMGYLLIVRGVALGGKLVALLEPGGSGRPSVDRFTAWLERLHVPTGDLISRLRDAAAELTARAAKLAAVVAGTTFHGLLMLFFVLLTLHFVLCNWHTLVRRAEVLSPLPPAHTRSLLQDFAREGRGVLLGTVITGLAQGALAGLGYLITGTPEAAFFAALTAVASLIPAVGTLLIWVPIGVFLILSGHTVAGIVELLYGAAVVVGISDYVLRPLLIRGHGKTPALLTFVALFGGLEVFGVIGLILGPVVMGLALAMLRIYEQDALRRREERPAQP